MTEHLTKETFKEKIFDYENQENWNFKGDKPTIIDFYADWCQPCKMVAPIIDELSEEYKDKIDIFKIDTENEQELASTFGIQSIPSILFIPVNEQPQISQGALPKNSIKEIIRDLFKIE